MGRGANVTDTAVVAELASLRASITLLAQSLGTRLTRQEVCARLGIHRNTLAAWVRDRRFPAPERDGRWTLAKIMEWETRR